MPGVDIDTVTFRKYRDADSYYQQDCEAMKVGDFTDIRCTPMQDIVMWEPMGSTANLREDKLGSSGRAILELRKVMLTQVRDADQAPGPDPIATPTSPLSKEWSPLADWWELRLHAPAPT